MNKPQIMFMSDFLCWIGLHRWRDRETHRGAEDEI